MWQLFLMNDPNRQDFKVMGHWETIPWFLWTAAHLGRGGIPHSDRAYIQEKERKRTGLEVDFIYNCRPKHVLYLIFIK